MEPRWAQSPLGDPPIPGTPPWAELQVGPEPLKAAEPGPPRSVIQLLAGSSNLIASNSSSRCLVVVSGIPTDGDAFGRSLWRLVCPAHRSQPRTRCRTRAGGVERSTGMCGQLGNGRINNSSSKLQRAKAHPSRCSSLPGFSRDCWYHFLFKNGVLVEYLASSRRGRLQRSVRRAG